MEQKKEFVWFCPMSKKNEKTSITNMLKGNFRWALNSRRLNSFKKLKNEQYCVFLGSQTNNVFITKITGKTELPIEIYKEWKFRPKDSKSEWTFGFTVENPKRLNIGVDEMYQRIKGYRKKVGTIRHFQSQSRLRIPVEILNDIKMS
jgi:hypothetical protein